MVPLRRCGSHAIRLRMNINPKYHSPYPLHVVDFLPLLDLYGDYKVCKKYPIQKVYHSTEHSVIS